MILLFRSVYTYISKSQNVALQAVMAEVLCTCVHVLMHADTQRHTHTYIRTEPIACVQKTTYQTFYSLNGVN